MKAGAYFAVLAIGFLGLTLSACGGHAETVVIGGQDYPVKMVNGLPMVEKDGDWLPRYEVDEKYRVALLTFLTLGMRNAKVKESFTSLRITFPDEKAYEFPLKRKLAFLSRAVGSRDNPIVRYTETGQEPSSSELAALYETTQSKLEAALQEGGYQIVPVNAGSKRN